MSILLIGCGYWGRNWAKTLYNMGELGAICEPDAGIQAQLSPQYPDIPWFATPDQALQECNTLQAVVIATPVSTHFEVARACLLANKAVLVEKPMTMSPEESLALCGMARERNLTLAVGHLLMYHPALLTLQKMIRDGDLGEMLSVQCTRVNLGKIRNHENSWWSLAPHDISILSLLLEEPIEPVSASGLAILGRPQIQDSVYAGFKTASGRTASIHVSWLSPVKKHETVVIGTQKIAVFDDAKPAGEKLRLLSYNLEIPPYPPPGGNSKDKRDPSSYLTDYKLGFGEVQRGDCVNIPYTPSDDLLTLEASAFLSAVREGTSLPNDGWNGYQVVQTLATVQDMLNRQQQPLKLTMESPV